ncbi:hypothetical protein JB92DRAFT_3140511 [Gautieria morchelliformis]|nr:hypothetical protein JB92DRAFT_3140511 [Gautieria morchelliformis]
MLTSIPSRQSLTIKQSLSMEDTCLVIRCPERAFGSHIPTEVYEEIFGWLRPTVDPDTDARWYRQTLACLAPVCRYFYSYATQEFYRCLDFDGAARTPDQRPTDTWCNGVLARLQPMETPPSDLTTGRELHDWIPQFGRPSPTEEFTVARMWDETFITRLPLVLPRLDKLRFFALVETALSYELMQSLGRLPSLEQLVLSRASADYRGWPSGSEPIFGPGKPFPALRQLTVEQMSKIGNDKVLKAMCATTSLRSLAIDDSKLLARCLPHITPQLVSLSGNFLSITVDTFRNFIKKHAALEDLSVFTDPHSYMPLHLDHDDLPKLKSFSGPFIMAPEFIRTRPVTRLILDLDSNISWLSLPPFLAPLCGFTVPPNLSIGYHIQLTHPYRPLNIPDEPDILAHLENIGNDIRELFVPIAAGARWGPQLGSYFPNVVNLQLELRDHLGGPLIGELTREHLTAIGEVLKNFTSLKSLMLLSRCEYSSYYMLSPGDQHDFVHIYQEKCPSLKTVVFGSLMVWHLRSVTTIMECGWELELLSPWVIQKRVHHISKFDELKPELKQVHDWKSKMAGLLSRELLVLISPSSSSCSPSLCH